MAPSEPVHPYVRLIHVIHNGYQNAAHTDLEIHCRGCVWRVHKLVVCEQCAFFEKACSDQWQKPARMVEGSATGVISVELNGAEDYPILVKGMLDHLYGLRYDFEKWEDVEALRADTKDRGAVKMSAGTYTGVEKESEETDRGGEEKSLDQRLGAVHQENAVATEKSAQATANETSDGDEANKDHNDNEHVDPHLEEPINYHVHMYALAEKYDIPSLRDVVCQNFKDCFKDSMLKPGFFDRTIWYVFNTTSIYAQDLREATMDLLSKHRDTVFEGEGFTKREDYMDTSFVTSLVQALIHRVSTASAQKQAEVDQMRYKCPKCHISFMGWSLRGPSQYAYPCCPNVDCGHCCARNRWSKYTVK